MRGRRRSSASSSRVRFSGASSGAAHRQWYRAIADHYDGFANPVWMGRTEVFLDRLFRRHGIGNAVDVACGTFAIDLRLAKRGYEIVGRDLSPDMIRVGRRALRMAGLRADLGVADMRTLRVRRKFDAVLCLGTAFNYLAEPRDVRLALRSFRHLLRQGGLLVLDLTNFDAFIDRPMNVRTEMDYRTSDGTRIGIFGFNDQNPSKTVHIARFLTVVQRGRDIRIGFDEAPLKVWRKEGIARALAREGFRLVEWWGDLRVGSQYRRKTSPRLVVVACAPDRTGKFRETP